MRMVVGSKGIWEAWVGEFEGKWEGNYHLEREFGRQRSCKSRVEAVYSSDFLFLEQAYARDNKSKHSARFPSI